MSLCQRCISRAAALLTVWLLAVAPVAAQTSVTLAWNANTESDIAGYALSYGTTSGNWPTAVDVGNVTQYTLNNLTRGTTYYFVLRAYNTDGLYSGPSAEIYAQIPYIDGTMSTTAPGLELMYQHTDGRLMSVRFSQFTQFGLAETLPTAPGDPAWKVVGLGDFNRDGRRDILWQHDTGPLAVWMMNGSMILDGAITNPSTPGDANWRVVACGDLDGDGYPDIVFRHRITNILAAWFMNGFNLRDGSSLSHQVADTGWKVKSAADLDGDRKADLIWQHTDGSLAGWLMNGANLRDGAIFTPSRVSDPRWTLMGTGQADADGRADLVWRHSDTGTTAVWMMNGFNLIDGAGLTMLPIVESGWRLVASR